LLLPQAVVALANGFQLPTAMAGALSVKPRIAGSAAGLNGFIQMSIGAIGAQFAGWVTALYASPLPLLICLFISVILAYISYKILVRR
jgi:MFS transporter, DHA1 family, multidrug resistance protein